LDICDDLNSRSIHSLRSLRNRSRVLRQESKSHDDEDGSLSSLSDDESKSGTRDKPNPIKAPSTPSDILLSRQLPQDTLRMPHSTKRQCALVFVDISGFTKLSTILDVESLSKVSPLQTLAPSDFRWLTDMQRLKRSSTHIFECLLMKS
jgi:hypothetical protein